MAADAVPVDKPIHVAARCSQLEDLEKFLARNERLNQPGAQGQTPLVAACCNPNNISCVTALLEAKASVNHRDSSGRTALLQACYSGAHEYIFPLVRAGASVEDADEHGQTPLLTACSFGDVKCAEQLLLARADPNACDRFGTTPLARSTTFKFTAIIGLLKRHGACDALPAKGTSPVPMLDRNEEPEGDHKADSSAPNEIQMQKRQPAFEHELHGAPSRKRSRPAVCATEAAPELEAKGEPAEVMGTDDAPSSPAIDVEEERCDFCFCGQAKRTDLMIVRCANQSCTRPYFHVRCVADSLRVPAAEIAAFTARLTEPSTGWFCGWRCQMGLSE